VSRLILHIGLPKSGSTAIQEYLAGNAAALADLGLRWLPGTRGNNCTELAIAFSHQQNAITTAYGVRTDRDRRLLRDRIAARLRTEVDHHQLIISSEHLSSLLRTPDEVLELAGFLRSLGLQPMIIGVIRRSDHWLPSAHAEAVRSGRTSRLDSGFVQRRVHLLDHERLLSRWSAAFDEVRLIPYLESDKSDPRSMPRRFLDACDVPTTATADWPQPTRLSRPTLSATATEALRRVNPELGLDQWRSGRERKRLVAVLADLYPGPGSRLSPAASRALADHDFLDTGIDTSPAAYGSGWQEWRTAAPVAVAEPVQLSDAEVDRTLKVLRRAGFGARRPIADRARQLLQQIRR
jgi:hypothetical protein